MEQGLEYKQPDVPNHYIILCFTCIIFFKSHSSQSGRYWWCCLVAELCLTLSRPHGLRPTSLLCPWDFPDKNTGVGSHLLLQEIFPTLGLNLRLVCVALAGRFFTISVTWEAPLSSYVNIIGSLSLIVGPFKYNKPYWFLVLNFSWNKHCYPGVLSLVLKRHIIFKYC